MGNKLPTLRDWEFLSDELPPQSFINAGLEAEKSIPMFISVAAFGGHRQLPAILAEVFFKTELLP